ncbi:MAG: right-handed parallel beta-helix repeat-containing protein [bacterium]
MLKERDLRMNFLIFVIVLLVLLSNCPCTTFVVDSAAIPGIQVSIFMRPLQSGDTLIIKPGTYTEKSRLDVPEGVTIIGEKGPEVTRIINISNSDNGVVLNSNCTLKGLDITNKQGGDNTVRIHENSNILIQDCIIHDAGGDGDCIKLTTAESVQIDHCIIYNPAERGGSGWQECVDHINSKNCTISNSWLFYQGYNGYRVLYAKGGSSDIIYENNIFGPIALGAGANFGSSTGQIGQEPYEYQGFRQTMRNNIFLYCANLVTAFFETKDSYFYNNLIYNCGRVFGAETSDAPADENRDGWIYNNIFYDDRGQMRTIYGWSAVTPFNNFNNDYNLYYNNGSALPGGNALNINEANGVYNDPKLTNPQKPVTSEGTKFSLSQIEEIKAWFKLLPGSPAIKSGAGTVTGAALFKPTYDFLGSKRSSDGTVDIGPHEYNSNSELIFWNNKVNKSSVSELRVWAVSSENISLQYNSNYSGYAGMSLLNLSGQMIARKNIFTVSGNRIYNWHIHENRGLGTGVYIIKFEDGFKKIISSKLLFTK